MPRRIDDNQIELTEFEPIDYKPHPGDDIGLIERKIIPTGQISYEASEDIMLQTGDRVQWDTYDGAPYKQGYFDGTVRWSAIRNSWLLQIRTGETDATDLVDFHRLILLDQ